MSNFEKSIKYVLIKVSKISFRAIKNVIKMLFVFKCGRSNSIHAILWLKIYGSI